MKKWLQRLFATLTNAKKKQQNKEQSGNETIVDREHLEGTPFWINRIEQGWFITYDKYKMTDFHPTKAEALKEIWLENKGWDTIAKLCIITHEQVANKSVELWEKRQQHIKEEQQERTTPTVAHYTKLKEKN